MSLDIQLIEPKPAQSPHGAAHSTLVNPLAKLAKDYLDLFNELVSMLEQIPKKPELYEN